MNFLIDFSVLSLLFCRVVNDGTWNSRAARPVGSFFLLRVLGVFLMALVKYGGGIVQMSGSIAGNVFARNRSGNYVRARTIPVNPNTDRQNIVRATIAYLADRWAQTLSAAQRTAWNLYADSVSMTNKLGEAINLSGFNHYIRSNSIQRSHSLPVIDNGPVVFELPAKDNTLALTASEATQQLTIAYDAGMDWADEDGGFLIIFQGTPQNPQRNFFDGPWRHIGNHFGADGNPPASPVIMGVQFAIAELQRLWIYARIIRADGRLSEPFRADTFCAA